MTTILVVEDDTFIRANLKLFLELEGYRVIEAENGAQGLAMTFSEKPDLILCDVMMPEIDGFEMLARLKANPAWTDIPFIFLTASAEGDTRNVGLALGADEYLTKPFNLAEVLALIRRRLGNA